MQRTIIVLAILAALGAYVYWVEIKGSEREERAERRAASLFTFDKERVDRVELENEHGRTLLKQEGGQWRMEQPVSAPADEAAVSTLLSTLSSAETKGEVSDPAELSVYGLEPPKASVGVSVDGETTTWHIGGRSPVSQNVYVRRPDEAMVYQASQSLDAVSTREPSSLREKRLFSFSGEDVTAVAMEGPHGKLRLVRSEEDWRVTEPTAFDSDDSLSRGIAQDLANIRANDWLVESAQPADLARYGLAKPYARVTARLATGDEHTLLIGKKEGGNRAAMVEGRRQIVTIADWSAEQLLKKPIELRLRRLFAVEPDEVERLVLSSDSKRLELVRAADGWSFAGEAQVEPSNDKVRELLEALTGLRATEWSEISAAERDERLLNPPLRTVTAYGKGGELLEHLTFGSEADGWAVWAQKDDPNAVAKVANDFVKNKWPASTEDLGL